MMFLVAIATGLAVTFQGGLNKYLSQDWGLASAVTLNLILTGIMGVVFYALVRFEVLNFPLFLQDKELAWKAWPLWIFIPSLCGFVIVLGIPWAIIKLGASKAIIIAIGAQILSSLLWDIFVDKVPVRTSQYIGAILTFIGSAIIIFR